MADITRCKDCLADIVWLTTITGHRMPFNATEFDGATGSDIGERWYIHRTRGAIPQDIAQGIPKNAPFLTRHRCIQSRISTGTTQLGWWTEINRQPGPRMADFPIEAPWRYDYRWASNYVHIARHAYMAICSARLPGMNSDREADRMESMPVCPKCMHLYTSGMAALQREAMRKPHSESQH
ncbi:hypothetical protein EQW78_17615 [Oerskovia turbata]|uniref:Uncharacterized protein n=1 Tax=Oerskovia turbata TaxID=1713 RepID=A0A4Q1KJ94_9CELL|nr:hypothetical protein [Oerskovia turbata]RXR21726.1 hypothetical protein EQW73_17695 [Oerskovia turbata]RXR29737.1 hypothetical protein EQW78_17615 [Oerskovia turbata]TGJ96945.1 hypothetical protein DLJ96_02565 [Actinotalea fermentans ATCC 43279 = JCM 9966 = DSM 3133]